MKKIIVVMLCIIFLTMSVGCGSSKVVNGKFCDTYGLLNKENKCHNVQYRTIVGNVIWGVIFFESIVIPVYLFGFSLYEPVGPSI